ncbi:hypothetical protein [Thermoanaerobacter mathranii]|uniref:hypothetical protein n=1 Tax=Thermoanaerobacter mathranii TaxID=583357 RepID=UPI003D6C1530
MPDWCRTEVIFEGENAKKLYEDWESAVEKNPEEKDYPWLGFLFENWEDEEEIDVYINKIFVDDYEFDREKQIVIFRIDEPYEPHFDVYDFISQKYKLKYYLLATEPANRIFINTDREKKYFSESYYFELWFPEKPIETKLFEKLKILDNIRYIEDFETIKELLEEYGIKTEDDMFKLCEYIEKTYQDVIVVFNTYTDYYIDTNPDESYIIFA